MSDRKFAKSHEWMTVEGNVATIGISDFAQKSLGDIVYLTLPEVGREVKIGEAFAEVESVKAVSEIYSPVDGKVIEVNSPLNDSPVSVNDKPYESWFAKIEFTKLADGLMSEGEYTKNVAAHKS